MARSFSLGTLPSQQDVDYRALSGIVRPFSEWYSSGKHRVTTSVISRMLLTVLTQAPEGHKLLLFLLLHTIRSIIRLLVIEGWAAQVDKLRLACLCSVVCFFCCPTPKVLPHPNPGGLLFLLLFTYSLYISLPLDHTTVDIPDS